MRILSFTEDTAKMTVTFTVKLDHNEYGDFDVQEFDPMEVIDEVKSNFNPISIQEIIYNYFKLPVTLQEKMKDAGEMGRFQRLVMIRRMCYYFLRNYTDLSLEEIGGLYGQDHSTAVYHINKVKEELEIGVKHTESSVKDIDETIKNQLNNG